MLCTFVMGVWDLIQCVDVLSLVYSYISFDIFLIILKDYQFITAVTIV
jgi:hypothetical protein